MPVDVQEFMNGIAVLADNENMRVTLKQSGKGGLIAGICCFIGGVVGGPIGLALGGTVGGLTAYKMTGNFKPVSEIIRNDLTMAQKTILYERIVQSVQQIEARDVVVLLPLIMSSVSLQQAALNTVVTFITNEMQHAITN